MDDNNLYLYLFELVKKGIYQFTNVSESIKNKIESDIELTPQEVITAIKDNPSLVADADKLYKATDVVPVFNPVAP